MLGGGGEEGLSSILMGKEEVVCSDRHRGNSIIIGVGASGSECAGLVVCSEQVRGYRG